MFGKNTSDETLDVVGLVVTSKTADEDVKFQAFVTDICHPLKNQKEKFAKKNFSHFRSLTLAIENCLKGSDRGILIDSAYYCNFMKKRSEKIRENADEPVALKSKLCYVLSENIVNRLRNGYETYFWNSLKKIPINI